MKIKKVALLFGGCSKEREVSISSKNSTLKALNELGYEVLEIDVSDNLKELVDTLQKESPDVVFNCLHGTMGEDGNIQAVLNCMKIPYTHSGVLASAIAMDKWKSYQLFIANQISTPKTWLIDVKENKNCPTDFPCVVKPVNEGSSVGLHLIKSANEWQNCLSNWAYGETAITQSYLQAREIHVAVFDDKALGTIEIYPVGHEIYNYTSKYTPGHLKTDCPAELSKHEEDLALNTALKAYKALGCRGLARIDMLFKDGIFYVLEVNTQPGFTSSSLSPKIAVSQGISFNEFVDRIVKLARCD